ncbi:hypothetical protein SCOR_33055 [Sulfidibacter corallicola]|uniref:Uncharacterized protein n=1 Tax=Sulfidibacter corallicola TaxID=2818388 RepID=A0A8A4TL76_SULCO|nr:hypothetical protein [Sulfidibacter corallicola]QTD49631.1 hypothetical protein J3U87_28935 [Sulfidibacter corallicola]
MIKPEIRKLNILIILFTLSITSFCTKHEFYYFVKAKEDEPFVIIFDHPNGDSADYSKKRIEYHVPQNGILFLESREPGSENVKMHFFYQKNNEWTEMPRDKMRLRVGEFLFNSDTKTYVTAHFFFPENSHKKMNDKSMIEMLEKAKREDVQ